MSVNHAFLTFSSIGLRPHGRIREAVARGWERVPWIGHVLTTRHQFAEIDDRMLKYLGISRAEVEFELSRSPWRFPPH